MVAVAVLYIMLGLLVRARAAVVVRRVVAVARAVAVGLLLVAMIGVAMVLVAAVVVVALVAVLRVIVLLVPVRLVAVILVAAIAVVVPGPVAVRDRAGGTLLDAGAAGPAYVGVRVFGLLLPFALMIAACVSEGVCSRDTSTLLIVQLWRARRSVGFPRLFLKSLPPRRPSPSSGHPRRCSRSCRRPTSSRCVRAASPP